MLHMTLMLAAFLLLTLGLCRGALAQPVGGGGLQGVEPSGGVSLTLPPSGAEQDLAEEGRDAAEVAEQPGPPARRGPSPQELSRQMQMSLRGAGLGPEGVKSGQPLSTAAPEKEDPAKVGPLIIGGTLAAEEARAARENADRVLRRSDTGKQETYVGIATGKGQEATKESEERESGGRGRLEGVDFRLDRDNAKIKWIFKF